MRVESAVIVALLGVLVLAVLFGGGVVRVIVGVLLGLGLQRHHAGGVEHVLVPALRNGLVHRRLEALDVDDGIGVADRGDLARGQLDVVRLGTGLGQAGDGTVVTRDALGDELQGVERRHDLQLTRLGRARLPGRAAGCHKEKGAADSDGAERARDVQHGNHFQITGNDFQIGVRRDRGMPTR